MGKKFLFIFVGLTALAVALFFIFSTNQVSAFESINAVNGDIEIHKSLTCGCCSTYASYVDGKVSPDVKAIDSKNPDEIKTKYGIPSELQSCHTTIIDGYFVEGHMPLEAVEKLLEERPNIKGIALPGMPSGSPGMPGPKSGDFVVYAVNNDGTYNEFMKI